MNRIEDSELVFPLECHFRVIAEDREHMGFVIETVLLELGITAPVTKVNTSRKGKYVSFNISIVVESRDVMNKIDQELRLIQGVKMVL
jgi:putative lipoic acid-binding regulatory protein